MDIGPGSKAWYATDAHKRRDKKAHGYRFQPVRGILDSNPRKYLIQDGVEVLRFEQLHLLSIQSYERELFFKQRSIRDNIHLFNFSETDTTLHADSLETAILYEMKVKLEEIKVLLAKYCMYLRTEKLDRRY